MKNLSGLLVVIGLLLSGCGSETTPTETPPDVDVAAEPEPENKRSRSLSTMAARNSRGGI